MTFCKIQVKAMGRSDTSKLSCTQAKAATLLKVLYFMLFSQFLSMCNGIISYLKDLTCTYWPWKLYPVDVKSNGKGYSLQIQSLDQCLGTANSQAGQGNFLKCRSDWPEKNSKGNAYYHKVMAKISQILSSFYQYAVMPTANGVNS